MEIKIDQNSISEAIKASATKAIAEALGGYSVTKSIAETVTKEVAEGTIAEAVRLAVKQIDKADLVKHLAIELQKAMVRGTVDLLHEGILNTVCKMRGIGDYSDSDKKQRERIKAKMFG